MKFLKGTTDPAYTGKTLHVFTYVLLYGITIIIHCESVFD